MRRSTSPFRAGRDGGRPNCAQNVADAMGSARPVPTGARMRSRACKLRSQRHHAPLGTRNGRRNRRSPDPQHRRCSPPDPRDPLNASLSAQLAAAVSTGGGLVMAAERSRAERSRTPCCWHRNARARGEGTSPRRGADDTFRCRGARRPAGWVAITFKNTARRRLPPGFPTI